LGVLPQTPYLLPSHAYRKIACRQTDINGWLSGRIEREADRFAAELLLPRSLAFKFQFEPSLRNVSALAQEYQCGFLTTLRRYIDLSRTKCAMVFSQDQKSRYFHASRLFPFRIPLSDLPHADSLANALFESRQTYELTHEVPPEYWITDGEGYSFRLFENSRFLPNLNAVVTLIWVG